MGFPRLFLHLLTGSWQKAESRKQTAWGSLLNGFLSHLFFAYFGDDVILLQKCHVYVVNLVTRFSVWSLNQNFDFFWLCLG